MIPCDGKQFPRNQRIRGQAGFPACRAGSKRLHCECNRRKVVRRQSGAHNHDKGDGGHIRERREMDRPIRFVASHSISRYSPLFLWSTLPPTSDHESVFLEDPSQHRHGSWWAGSVDPRVNQPAPLVGAWQSPRVPHCPVRGHFAHPRSLRHPVLRTPIQQCYPGGPL